LGLPNFENLKHFLQGFVKEADEEAQCRGCEPRQDEYTFPPLPLSRHSQDSSLRHGDDYDSFLLLLQRSLVLGSSVRLSRTTMACPIVADGTEGNQASRKFDAENVCLNRRHA